MNKILLSSFKVSIPGSGKRPGTHKPLLMLLALGEIQRGNTGLIPLLPGMSHQFLKVGVGNNFNYHR
jgi:hypothetical protein